MSNLKQIISERKSCRTFLHQNLTTEHQNEIKKYISSLKDGIFSKSLDIKLIMKPKDDSQVMKLDYGVISGHCNYLLGKTANDVASLVNYGFQVEKLVLYATEMGLQTCWVGYFDKEYFPEIELKANEVIPSIILIGYGTKKQGITAGLLRFAAGSARRKEWKDLFFCDDLFTPLTFSKSGKYADALEMLRLAPSSGNSQPWRVLFDSKTNHFHFLKKPIVKKYEKDGMHYVDMGIALAHFDLACKQSNLKGKWIFVPEQESFQKDYIDYIVSWKIDEK